MKSKQKIPAESSHPKELFTSSNQTIALQIRLILSGEALKPTKQDLPAATAEQLTGAGSKTYELLENA